MAATQPLCLLQTREVLGPRVLFGRVHGTLR
jgi:hypothetical protein